MIRRDVDLMEAIERAFNGQRVYAVRLEELDANTPIGLLKDAVGYCVYEEEPEPKPEKKKRGRPKKIDTGMIRALSEGGWPPEKIADDMRLDVETVLAHMEE